MIIHQPSQSLLLKAKDVAAVQALLPHHKLLDYQGHNIAVRHDLEATKILRNIGLKKVPSPIRYYYNWPGKWKPLPHQIATSEFLTLHRKGFVLNEMGTMKTASALWAADYLMNLGVVNKCLIVAPLSTLKLVWEAEIFATCMHRSATIITGDRQRRLDKLQYDSDFYIVNHDGLKVIDEGLVGRSDINLWIIDEAAYLRNYDTERYKHFKKILPSNNMLWLLTGTPCPNEPTDAWGLARLVSPQRVPHYFGKFQKEVMVKVSTYKWIPRAGATERAFEAMQPAIRFKKSDCISMPPVVPQNRQVSITKEQEKAFKTMKNAMQSVLSSGAVTAANAADQIMKLRQILCGGIKNAAGDYDIIDHGPRTQELLDCIQQASAKVLVIVPFKGITYALQKELSPHYTCEVVNGDVTLNKRNDIFKRYKELDNPRVLLCHPQVMAHGLNLTEADMMIFYAPFYSNEQMQQVLERMARPGQTKTMTIVRMGAHRLEWEIYSAVEGRRLTQAKILDLYKEIANEK